MEITLTDCQYMINRHARGDLPPGYAIATIQVVCNDQGEVYELINSMQQWANGTFEPVVVSRPDPDGPLIVSPVEEPEELSVEDIDIDPITGYPR